MHAERRNALSAAILIGYALILVAVAGMGWFFSNTLTRMQTITQALYLHPFAVSNAAVELEGSVFQLRNHMLQIALDQIDAPELAHIQSDMVLLDTAMAADLDIIKANFLGDAGQVKLLDTKLKAWSTLRKEILQDVLNKNVDHAKHLVKTVGTQRFSEIEPLVEYVETFSKLKGQALSIQAEEEAARMIKQAYALITLIITFIMLTAFLVFQRAGHLHQQLNRQATHDDLTGVPNRRYFIEVLAREQIRNRRYTSPYALAIADLDFFKHINDTHGHAMGDLALKKFCAICTQSLRDSDFFARIGGEEFAILLPNTSLEVAAEVVERLRKAIESTIDLKGPFGEVIELTASFGITIAEPHDEDANAILKRADKALYTAKATGRNKVCTSWIETVALRA